MKSLSLLLFCICALLQASTAYSHCGRSFSEFFPKLQKEILSSRSYREFARTDGVRLTSTELKQAIEVARDIKREYYYSDVQLTSESLSEINDLSKYIVKNQDEFKVAELKAMDNLVKGDIQTLKESEESVAIFHALPLNSEDYENVFGISPSFDTSTNRTTELVQSISGNKFLIKQHENAGKLVEDINSFSGVPIIVAHNDSGILQLPGFEQTLPLSAIQDACKESGKRCVVLSCKARKHLEDGGNNGNNGNNGNGGDVLANECKIKPHTALAIAGDLAKYVESDEFERNSDRASLKKMNSIIQGHEKNILGQCSMALVLFSGGAFTTGAYFTFND